MNDMIDLDGIKAIVSGIGDQISTAINIEKERQRAESVEADIYKRLYGVNMIDNWYLKSPINQRNITGPVETPADTLLYNVDRWYTKGTRKGSVEVVKDKGIKITYLGEPDGHYTFEQRIDVGYNAIAGRTMTFSAIIDDQLYTCTGTAPDTQPNETTTIGYANCPNNVIIFGWSIGIQCLWIGFNLSHQIGVTVSAAKLEMGERQTLAYQDADGNWIINDPPPNYQQELEKCQRYQCWFKEKDPVGYFRKDNDKLNMYIPLPTPLRVLPRMVGTRVRLLSGDYNANHVVSFVDINNAPVIAMGPCLLNIRIDSDITRGAFGYIDLYEITSLLVDANL